MNTISETEIETITSLLSQLTPGYLPFSIFCQVARLTATPIVELVPLRFINGRSEVLLLKRDPDDPIYSGKVHVPGTVVRATDTLDTAFHRLFAEELKGIALSSPVFVKNVIHHSGRGNEVAQIYWAEVITAPKDARFYDANDLPAELIMSQLDFIPDVVNEYAQTRQVRNQKSTTTPRLLAVGTN